MFQIAKFCTPNPRSALLLGTQGKESRNPLSSILQNICNSSKRGQARLECYVRASCGIHNSSSYGKGWRGFLHKDMKPYVPASRVKPLLPKRDIFPTLLLMNERRKQIRKDEIIRFGEEKVTKRSDFLEWNYSAELSAFAARLREEFNPSKLSEAFLNPSYIEEEKRRQQELGMEEDDNTFNLTTNEELADKGASFTVNILMQYTRAAFPYLPEEGVKALVDYCMSLDVLSNVSFHIGTRDLIRSQEYPPYQETYRQTFLAIVGALVETNQIKATRFVIDIVASQLHVADINELWNIEDPLQILITVLKNDNREAPEARLMWLSGRDTIMACYHIGMYCNKEIIGQAQGETAEIAEDMAARDALRRLFRTDDSICPNLPMGDERLAKLDFRSKPNLKVAEWAESKIKESKVPDEQKQIKDQSA